MNGFPPLGDVPTQPGWRGAVVMSFDAEGRVFMQLRDDHPGLVGAGLWSLFGGGVEEGEDLHSAALREFHEETGIALPADSLYPYASLPSTARKDAALYIFRTSHIVAPHQVVLSEGAGFGFLNRQQIRDFPVLPQFRALLLQRVWSESDGDT